ncbi:hypothetical protein HY732_03250 [Candidatus Uhrbacteria bacterium]|nr:hypothetical protein [Candidatus Uhrbacteria bacterium]
METLTIPKNLTRQGELIIIARKEYEELRSLRKAMEFTPTPAQRRALLRAEKNLSKEKTLSYHDLAKGLGFTH